MPPLRAPESLAQTEKLLSQLIRTPGGVAEALRSDASGHLVEQLERAVRGDAARPAALRVQVYANAYFVRILNCLKDDYAALAHWMGDAGFNDLTALYLMAHPSRHPSIAYVGERVAEFVRDHPAAQPFRKRFPWAADLADLEWALQRAFDAPDAEPLAAAALAALDPEDWAELELRADPSLRLLQLEWPAEALRRRFERDEPAQLERLVAERQRVLVWRRGERVAYRPVDADEGQALQLICAGIPFGDLCEQATDWVGEEEAPGWAAAWLSRWLADGCIRR